MESTKETILNSANRYRKRIEENKEDAYRRLYLRIGYAFIRDGHLKRMGGNCLSVLLTLCSHMNREKTAYPSLELIANEAGMHKNTVPPLLIKLETTGWIKKIGRVKSVRGKFGNMKYQILETNLIRAGGDANFFNEPATKIVCGPQGYHTQSTVCGELGHKNKES